MKKPNAQNAAHMKEMDILLKALYTQQQIANATIVIPNINCNLTI